MVQINEIIHVLNIFISIQIIFKQATNEFNISISPAIPFIPPNKYQYDMSTCKSCGLFNFGRRAIISTNIKSL